MRRPEPARLGMFQVDENTPTRSRPAFRPRVWSCRLRAPRTHASPPCAFGRVDSETVLPWRTVGTLVGGLWSGAAFGVALVVSLLGSAREASACSPPPDGWFPSGVFPTPANGVMLLRYACYMGCETPPNVESLRLKGEAGELVPGSVIFSQAFDTELEIAFRPEPGALTEAGVYTAELEGVPTVAGILVGPAMTWNDALTLSEDIF